MGSYLRQQIDGEDSVGPRNPHIGDWPRRCAVCGQVHGLGECPVILETEQRLAELAQQAAKTTSPKSIRDRQ